MARRRHGRAPRWDMPDMSCAGCQGKTDRLLNVMELVGTKLWPAFPICRHCYQQYQDMPDRQAADRFVLHLAEEMARRVR
jgi:hypothetical protein